ncbi:MAG: hypothetical protein HFF39_01810 [Lawsonibacter sp.]|nr:hypothetical protein [Lawsonibacter sp.]
MIQSSRQFFLGLALYLPGLAVCAASAAGCGPQTGGACRFSCNPMYLSYFLFFLGCAALTQPLLLFCAVLIFQISSHWIIPAEERRYAAQFGASYRQYLARVRRHL